MLIHIRDGIDFQERNTDLAVLENQMVDLKLGDVKICLMSVYRSPNSKTENNSRLNEKIRTLGESDRKMKTQGDYHLLNKLLDQDWASLLEHKDMEDSWTIFKSKRKQAVSAATPIVKIMKGKKKNFH